MPKFLSKDDFRSRYGLKERTVTLKNGEIFKIRSLNMLQKRSIRESNMTVNMTSDGTKTNINIESLMIDTIVAACVEPSFNDGDIEWLQNGIDSTIINDLYQAIETPVKLAALADPEVASKSI